MIPLPGHTRGHCGIAIATPGGWLFHCGDAASPFHRDADPHQRTRSQHVLDILPAWFAKRVIGPHVPRLRHLLEVHGDEVQLISAHDIYSFAHFREWTSVEANRSNEHFSNLRDDS
jgi:glyoxylase-like metal-dependent hydrolase (beta-lactamase superfamily II)